MPWPCGRRFITINNNQMEDGANVEGCVGEEARLGENVWGGQLPVIWSRILIDKKNREMGVEANASNSTQVADLTLEIEILIKL